MRVIQIQDIQKIIAYNDSRPVAPYQQIGMWQVGDMVVCDYRQAIEFSSIPEKELLKSWPQFYIKNYGGAVFEKHRVPSGTESEVDLWLQNPKFEMAAIVLASKFDQLTGLPSVWKESDWQTIERDGKEYKKIVSFDRYFHESEDASNPLNFALINQFDGYFETEAEYQAWINSTDIVPVLHILEDISNCPSDPTVTRKAELSRLPVTDFLKNVTAVEWRIKHFRDGVYIPVEIPDIDLTFQATTDIQREYPAGSGLFKSEYEIMIDMQNAGYKVWEIAISELHYNDSKGLLDEKCNYGH